MIRVVWRQQRAQLITLLGVLVVAVGVVLVARASMTSYLDGHGLTACVTGGVQGNGCGNDVAQSFQDIWFDRMKVAQLFVLALPVLIGLFCGAPLFARELEQGTHVLAFTQSVSRLRWMTSKLLVSAVPALLVVAVVQLLVEWWVAAAGKIGPLASGPYFYVTFGSSSFAPLAYTVFAFTLGMFVGAASRRTLVAMTVTLGVTVVLRYILSTAQQFLVPAQRIVSDDPSQSIYERGSLEVFGGYLDANGTIVPTAKAADAIGKCGSRGDAAPITDSAACYRDHGLAKWFADVIPVSAASTVHLVEAAIYLGLAVVLVLGTGWAVRRQA
ncbi:ABC transporter permease subunit [Kutzneria chonburiensis]|uniref:ABC transporter permease subunit n=1 Tax=Kutzneria chonburiensis TaxID=1483604 RepID=A0ABV6N7I9_9PSEU|nr:ABC transporter permease subunit [Kutzneria chonburiensis]